MIHRWNTAALAGVRPRALNLPDAERQANEAAWVGHCNGPLDLVSFGAAVRWTAATSGAWEVMHEATAIYRLADGNDQRERNRGRGCRRHPPEHPRHAHRARGVGRDRVHGIRRGAPRAASW
jgi:hypothetical protein